MTVVLTKNSFFNEFFEASKPGQVFLDVGAYDGDTVQWAKQLQPGLRCIAVEPVQDLALKIKNRFPGAEVLVIPYGASDRTQKVQFHEFEPPYQGCSTAYGYMATNTNQPSKIVELEVHRLDTLLLANGITSVDYVKIDCEGHEEAALRGLTLYHPGTRFHVEYHITNLASILLTLREMSVEVHKITVSRDATNGVPVGFVLGEAK